MNSCLHLKGPACSTSGTLSASFALWTMRSILKITCIGGNRLDSQPVCGSTLIFLGFDCSKLLRMARLACRSFGEKISVKEPKRPSCKFWRYFLSESLVSLASEKNEGELLASVETPPTESSSESLRVQTNPLLCLKYINYLPPRCMGKR